MQIAVSEHGSHSSFEKSEVRNVSAGSYFEEHPIGMKKFVIDILSKHRKTIDDLKKEKTIIVTSDGYKDLHLEYIGQEKCENTNYERYAVSQTKNRDNNAINAPKIEFLNFRHDPKWNVSAFFRDDIETPISLSLLQCQNNKLTAFTDRLNTDSFANRDWVKILKQQGFTQGSLFTASHDLISSIDLYGKCRFPNGKLCRY